jgi:hypothetical protein
MRGLKFRRKFGLPVRRCVDGVVSDEAQNGPVQSEICAGPSHGSGGDENWEDGECNMNIGETPKHLISYSRGWGGSTAHILSNRNGLYLSL